MGHVYADSGSRCAFVTGGGDRGCEGPAVMDSDGDILGNVGADDWNAGFSKFARLMLPMLDDDPD